MEFSKDDKPIELIIGIALVYVGVLGLVALWWPK
jgi:hypothetical protein